MPDRPDNSEMRQRVERWVAQLDRFASTADRVRRTALAAADAAGEHADEALDLLKQIEQRAGGRADLASTVKRSREAAETAQQRRREAEEAYRRLVDVIEQLTAVRKTFDAAVAEQDAEAAQSAIGSAEKLAAVAAEADREINAARDAAASVVAELRKIAAGLADTDDGDEGRDHEAAVRRAGTTANAVDEQLAKLRSELDEIVDAVDDAAQQVAKAQRCAERAARSDVHGPVARAAADEAREHAAKAIEIRKEIEALVGELSKLGAQIRELADKAVALHEEQPTDDTVAALAERVDELRASMTERHDRLRQLLARLRQHLAAIREAAEAACDAATAARLETPRPTGGDGVLRPPQPQPVPDLDPSPTDRPDESDEQPQRTGEVPLLLVPVRLETRFGQPGDKTTPLRIRIYPDRIGVIDDRTLPTSAEVDIARQYWKAHLDAQRDSDERDEHAAATADAAWAWLVDQLDLHRAGHVARLTRPSERNGRLVWPDVETSDVDGAAEATNLPHRFVAIGWSNGVEVFRERGAVLDDDPYHTSPDPAGAVERTDHGIAVTKHMRWTVDYDNAVERGMAITVDVDRSWGTIDTLIVAGIGRRDEADSAEAFARLLDTHSVSQGFAFVPQGTPTNNTDTVDAGWTRRQRERDVVAEQRRVDLSGKLDVAATSNAARFARSLGIAHSERLVRQPFALDTEFARGAAMRAGLYDVVIGRYLSELLPTPGTRVLTDPGHEEFRRWFVEHVTGGATVPTFRVGPQPYAVLPVLRPGNADVRPDIGRRVRRVVQRLKDEWLRTLDDGVARLDHEVGDDPDAVRGNIAEVLAGEPHPADLVVRRLDLHDRTSSQFDQMAMATLVDFQDGQPVTSGELTWVEIDNGFVGEFEIDLEHIEATAPDLWAELVAMRQELGVPETIEDQLVLWTKFQQLVAAIERNPWGEAAEANVWIRGQLRAAADVLQETNDVVAGLAAHEQRQRPLTSMHIPGFNGVLGQDNPPLIVSKFDATADAVERPLVADDAFAPADYVGPAIRGETIASLDQAPLLAQLLVSAASTRRLPEPMRTRTIVELAQATDDELEWTLRETLGLGIHRLDAWHTAFANQELDALRGRRPEGLHVGSYGWVIDLDIPAGSVERPSRGFVHAPSLGHAATASVLRSAWHARGDADGRSPAAVDLRSNRYRYATWLIEGIRAGQPLGDLLGYEFERLCHDLGIDEQIARVRRVVGEASGRHDAIDDPVDGIELMELFDAGGLAAHLAAVGAEFGPARAATLRLLLEGLTWSFDAVDDALLAESTHHLLAGNFDRAAAAIESTSGGDLPPPMPIGMDSTRPTRTINHKVLLLAEAAPAPPTSWSVGLRDRVAPALEAVAATLLPAPNDVAVTVVDDRGSIHAHRLVDLGLSALDALYLTSDDPTMVDAPLTEIIRLATGISGTVDTALDPAGAGVTLEEFQIVATAVRRVLSEARPASVDDLDPTLVGSAAPTTATVDADTVLGDVLGDLATVGGPVDDARRRRLAIVGVTGDDEQIQQVFARRLESARALGVADGAEIVGAVFGRPFPVSPTIELATSAAAFDAALAGHDEVMAWLDDVSLVRPDVDRLLSATGLASVIGADASLTAGTAQTPRHPRDEWAATGLPEPDTGGRNVVTAMWTGASTTPPEQVVGLVVDQWSEQLPGESTVTGVAMHYDAPSQRPPQALVLGVPETDEPWTLDHAIGLLLETMEWMQLRAVAPEDLGDYGHTIPTVFADAVLHVDATGDGEDAS